MKISCPFGLCVCLLIIESNVRSVETLEPVTTGLATAGALLASVFLAAKDVVYCKFKECCDDPWLKSNMTGIYYSVDQVLLLYKYSVQARSWERDINRRNLNSMNVHIKKKSFLHYLDV